MKIRNLSKTFSGESGFTINLVKDLNLEITRPAIYTILAPLGSGKTTLLKIVSGIETKTGGEIVLEPHSKPVFIPSHTSSLPWFNVSENFNLVTNEQDKKNEIIKLLGLEGYEKHFPGNKSLGFRFLVSLGMALLSGADLILVDDPFTGLSDLMKEKVTKILRDAVELKRVSIIVALSNISDSILISDKVYVMESNPLSVIDEVDISLGKERNLELLNSQKADDFKKKIVDSFNRKDIGKVITISI